MASSIPFPLRANLIQYVNDQFPFGPPNATTIKEPDCAARLYESDNAAFADLLKGSHIIVGRRGSGKSALLGTFGNRSHLRDQLAAHGREYRTRYNIDVKSISTPDIVVSLNTPRQIFEVENECRHDGTIPPVEMLAERWSMRIWLELGRAIRAQNLSLWSALPLAVREYVDSSDLRAARVALERDEFITRMQYAVTQSGKHYVILIDNTERYDFTDLQNRVLAGLCAAVQDFISAHRSPVDVKMCLPAEIFDYFSTHIANPDKDFHTVQHLNWKSAELMRIAAHRLKVYLQLYDQEAFEQADRFRLSDRDDLKKFWRQYLPPTVTNRLGWKEDSFLYILRHTHLLPRQVLTILNGIAREELRLHANGSAATPGTTGRLFQSVFDEKAVMAGIQAAEEPSAKIILAMFASQFPHIEQVFAQVMPRLRRVFKYGLFQQVYTESGRDPMSRMGKDDFWLFWRMMLMTGAIGVVDSSAKSDCYVMGHFEFNSNHPLYIGDKDKLCVHPMFSTFYNVDGGGENKVVLPRGADMLTEEETSC